MQIHILAFYSPYRIRSLSLLFTCGVEAAGCVSSDSYVYVSVLECKEQNVEDSWSAHAQYAVETVTVLIILAMRMNNVCIPVNK